MYPPVWIRTENVTDSHHCWKAEFENLNFFSSGKTLSCFLYWRLFYWSSPFPGCCCEEWGPSSAQSHPRLCHPPLCGHPQSLWPAGAAGIRPTCATGSASGSAAGVRPATLGDGAAGHALGRAARRPGDHSPAHHPSPAGHRGGPPGPATHPAATAGTVSDQTDANSAPCTTESQQKSF